jgi:Ras-related protein Rab-18
MDPEPFKIIMIGDTSVGKTSLMRRYIEGIYNEKTLSTIGIELFKKEVSIQNKNYVMKIWDTCGQERFRAISKNYYHNADGIMLVFDINFRKSFDNLSGWIGSIYQNTSKDTPLIIVASKCDLEHLVTDQEIEEYSTKNKVKVFKTSSKDNINVEATFLYLGEEIIKKGLIKIKNAELKDVNALKKNKKRKIKC